MKAPHRSALLAAGLVVATAATALPSVAGAQRQQVPGPDTKRVLVTTFRGDPDGGVKAANEIRDRIQSEFNIRQLMPVNKKDIDNTLTSSGYKPDSALNANDIKELAKLVRADEVIDGTVTKTANGYRVATRFFLPRDVGITQPLVTVESNNLGDVAKQVVREYDAARKQLKDNQDCENAIRASNRAAAIAAARKGISTYTKATISRLCLASAYQLAKSSADSTGPWKDSVIAVTREITNLDKQSPIALRLQYDAYKAKSDTADALASLVGLMGADPNNAQLREQVIAELVNSGKPDVAIPIVKQLVADNPGDPQYARTYWLVLRAANRHKEAVEAGQAYVALDSAAADSNYFFRQIADLAADSAYAKAAELAATGAARYPQNSSLLLLKGQNELKAGQLPAAKASLARAMQLDPKAAGANLLLAQIDAGMGDVAGAVAAVKADVALDPSNKDRDAAFLLTLAGQSYKAAAASKKAEDFRKALAIAQASEAVSPSVNSEFYMAISAFQTLAVSAQELQKSKSCEDYKQASELVSIVSLNMPKAGKVDPGTAGQILSNLPQFQAFIDGSIKKYCK